MVNNASRMYGLLHYFLGFLLPIDIHGSAQASARYKRTDPMLVGLSHSSKGRDARDVHCLQGMKASWLVSVRRVSGEGAQPIPLRTDAEQTTLQMKGYSGCFVGHS